MKNLLIDQGVINISVLMSMTVCKILYNKIFVYECVLSSTYMIDLVKLVVVNMLIVNVLRRFETFFFLLPELMITYNYYWKCDDGCLE